jgi:HSP20 family protein
MLDCEVPNRVGMSDDPSSRNKPEPEAGLKASAGETLPRWVIVRHSSAWRPPTDVYEHDDRLIVVVEIAGMRDSDFKVTLHSQRLIISGTRQRIPSAECAYYQLEIPVGEFRTEVSLPWAVMRDDVSAIYRDGLLRVELTRAPAQKVQVVNIDVGE